MDPATGWEGKTRTTNHALKDRGDYRCFVAVNAQDAFIGLGIVDLAPLGFGPLAKQNKYYTVVISNPEISAIPPSHPSLRAGLSYK